MYSFLVDDTSEHRKAKDADSVVATKIYNEWTIEGFNEEKSKVKII